MQTATAPGDGRPSTPTPSQLPPVPSSPVYSFASTANPLSSYHLPLPPPPQPLHAILTKSDLEASQAAYTDLIQTAKSYRLALASLSTAASAFGSALESCARLKEARAESLDSISQPAAALSSSFTAGPTGACTADLLLSASGVHHLVANHHHILSETVYRDFEVPLLHELDKWRQRVDDEEDAYKRDVRARNQEIARLEKEGLRLHKQRRRDVHSFRAHLVDLTTKLDGLTSLHGDHARTLLRESQDTSGRILDASCSLVRAEVDIFESLAKKGWTGGGLDDLLEKGADLFANDEVGEYPGLVGGPGGPGGPADSAKLFSILPPKSILADAASDVTRHGGHHRGDSLLSDPDRYQSLTGAAAPTAPANGPGLGCAADDNDTDSIFSETNFNRSRGVRPFSPQPIRRHATDVTFDSLGVGLGEDPRRQHDVLSERDEGEAHEQADFKSPWEEEAQYRGGGGGGAAAEGGAHGGGGPGNAEANEAAEDDDAEDGAAEERGRPGRRWSVSEDDGA